MTARRFVLPLVLTATAAAYVVATQGCVPSGSAPPYDAGPPPKVTRDSPGALTTMFEEDFEHITPGPVIAPTAPSALTLLPEAGVDASLGADAASAHDAATQLAIDAGISLLADAGPLLLAADAGAAVSSSPLGPNWQVALGSNAWKIENGRLCGKGALNRGVWLKRILPVNARIEFDGISDSADGDLKAEVWGDGKSGATATSYTNATSYIVVLGGWKNTFHVLARRNEHGKDRKEIKVDKESDDPREHPVSVGQTYRFKIERSDGHTVRYSVNGLELMSYDDPDPLSGVGHDHLGFNNYWDNVKSCYDNVKITPL